MRTIFVKILLPRICSFQPPWIVKRPGSRRGSCFGGLWVLALSGWAAHLQVFIVLLSFVFLWGYFWSITTFTNIKWNIFLQGGVAAPLGPVGPNSGSGNEVFRDRHHPSARRRGGGRKCSWQGGGHEAKVKRSRVWRVPATRPDPNFFFATRTRPELFFKISEFRVFPSRVFPSRPL